MSGREQHLETLVGRTVRDVNGRPVGRLEEVCATDARSDHRVTDYLIGASGWLARMHVRRLRHPHRVHGWRARWDQMDLSTPGRPRLTCTREELERLSG